MKYLIDTWKCETCGYSQDFEPLYDSHVYHNLGGVPDGKCANCFRKRVDSNMTIAADKDKIVMTVVDEEAILNAAKISRDADGTEIKDGEGKVVTEALTQKEKNDLLAKRSADIAYLDAAPNAKLVAESEIVIS